MKVVAVINVGGGSIHGQEVGALRDRLRAAFEKHAIEARLELVEGEALPQAARRAAAEVRRGAADAVVAGGGDGTISAVAAEVVRTDIPIGVLPLGTLNHFAKDLGIPADVEPAVEIIAAAASRAIDAGEVNGQVFINNSSVGLYPHMVVDRERRALLKRFPKQVATLVAVVRLLRRWPVRRLSLHAEGRVERFRTPFLFVGNNAYDIASMGTRAALDGGALWAAIARRQSRLAFVGLVTRSLLHRITEQDLQVLELPSLTVRSRASRLLVAMDGEVLVLRPPLVYRSIPGGLRVYAPAGDRGGPSV